MHTREFYLFIGHGIVHLGCEEEFEGSDFGIIMQGKRYFQRRIGRHPQLHTFGQGRRFRKILQVASGQSQIHCRVRNDIDFDGLQHSTGDLDPPTHPRTHARTHSMTKDSFSAVCVCGESLTSPPVRDLYRVFPLPKSPLEVNFTPLGLASMRTTKRSDIKEVSTQEGGQASRSVARWQVFEGKGE